jgi:RND family efflux transporter MFP subunit
MKHFSSADRLIFHLVAGVLLLPVVSGCRKAAEPAGEETSVAPVKVAEAHSEKIDEWTELLGTTQPLPDRAAKITAVVEGHVHSVLHDPDGKAVVEGQKVGKGQVVVHLDDRGARASRDKAKAQLEEVDEQQKQAEFAEKTAKLDVDRLEKLQPGDTARDTLPLVSRIELEKARLALQSAQAQRKALAARRRSLEAEVKSLEIHLDYYALRAPIAGTLGVLQVVPGQTLPIGTTVAEVVNLDEVDVLCPVPRHTAARLSVGQPARLVGGSEKESEPANTGKIVFIAVQAQPETGNFLVKVRFPNKDMKMRANTVVRVEVQTQPEEARLTIPESALMEDSDPPAVVIVTDIEEKKNEKGEAEKLGKARIVSAIVGIHDPARKLVEIKRLERSEEGKKSEIPIKDAQIVVIGGRGLKDGDAVRIEEKKEEKHE